MKRQNRKEKENGDIVENESPKAPDDASAAKMEEIKPEEPEASAKDRRINRGYKNERSTNHKKLRRSVRRFIE